MDKRFTFRLDPETARILMELTKRAGESKTRAIREALRAHHRALGLTAGPSAWESYRKLKIPGVKPYMDTARHVERLLRDKLRAKLRQGTL